MNRRLGFLFFMVSFHIGAFSQNATDFTFSYNKIPFGKGINEVLELVNNQIVEETTAYVNFVSDFKLSLFKDHLKSG